MLTGRDEKERIRDITAITTIRHTLQHMHWASPDIINYSIIIIIEKVLI